MAKPTNLALWATTGTKVEPSAGVKQAGWAANQRPPAQWFNWWMNAVYLWMVWLDAFESTAHDWTADQTFHNPVTFAVSGTDVQFIDGFRSLGTAQFDLNVTIGTTLDVTGAVTFGDNLDVAGDTTLAGSLTTQALTANGTGLFTAGLQSNTGLDFTGSAPVKTDVVHNRSVAENTLRAWCRFTCNNSVAPAFDDGLNVASVVQDASSGLITITFAQPFANQAYGVVCVADLGTTMVCDLFSTGIGDTGGRSTNQCTFKFALLAAPSVYRNTAQLNGYSFTVFFAGRQ